MVQSVSGSSVERAPFERTYLTGTLSRLAQVPTNVPLGFDTLIEPDDPKLVSYVQHHIRPELVRLGADDLVDAGRNNLIARFGSGTSGRSLLIQNYTPAQHNNLMDDPWSGRVEGPSDLTGAPGKPTVIHGQGVSQAKAHQAVMLAVIKHLVEDATQIQGRLYWAVNNEGRSSHQCSESVLEALRNEPSPEFAIVQVNTDLGVSLGNRGRVDIDIRVIGRPTHSSSPEAGASAIEAVRQILNRVEELQVSGAHPLLGPRSLVPYKVDFHPLAPHTIPGEARLTLDCRLLPGDDPIRAANGVIEHLGELPPWEVAATPGVYMLPALVDPNHPWVRELQAAARWSVGTELHEYHAPGAFDAGGLCAAGIPAVMFGAGRTAATVEPDWVSLADVESEAATLHRLIVSTLT